MHLVKISKETSVHSLATAFFSWSSWMCSWLPGKSLDKNLAQRLAIDFPTNTLSVFHVETTWKRPFPRCFNVEYTRCVCRVHVPARSGCDRGWDEIFRIIFQRGLQSFGFVNDNSDIVKILATLYIILLFFKVLINNVYVTIIYFPISQGLTMKAFIFNGSSVDLQQLRKIR